MCHRQPALLYANPSFGFADADKDSREVSRVEYGPNKPIHARYGPNKPIHARGVVYLQYWSSTWNAKAAITTSRENMLRRCDELGQTHSLLTECD